VVFLANGFDCGKTILGEDLAEFESQTDALSHTLDLDGTVLFEDQLR